MNRQNWYIIPLLIFMFHLQQATCQIWINEFMAANSSINQDPDYSEYSDWVELYNSGSVAVNLKGYYLTDNFGSPSKWQITENIYIESEGFVIIWTDDMNIGMHTNYKLSAEGEEIALYSPGLILLDSLTFLVQKTDISAGRSQDGSGVWGYYLIPTPGTSNNTSEFFTDFAKNTPEFSLRGGIYDKPQSVKLNSRMSGIIRYTLDGSDPQETSMLYVTPIDLSANTIVRARIFKTGMIPGPVVTQSYFLEGDLKNRKLPVVSISTDPLNLWDSQKGIYVQNYKPLWEISANIELFENNGSDRAAFNEQVGIKINGLYSWKLPQKMLGIYFRGKYGPSNLAYPLLFHKQRPSYKNFALRASGSDWSYTLFRDVLGQDVSRLNTELDFVDFRPSIVFFNGHYMGIHNIREKVDADFIEKNHNIEPGTFDLVENEEFAESGDLINYNILLDLLSKDMSQNANFEAVTEIVDIENFTDLVITEMATGNTSIDHNVMAWKPKESGKWKWIIMDLDRGFFNPYNNMINFYVQQNSWPFKKLWNNEGYRFYFGKRLADQLYTTYHPERIKMLIDSHAGAIENEIPYHVERWLGATSSYGNAMPSVNYWYNEVCNLKTFVEERPQALLANLAQYGFRGTANLCLSVYPTNAGTIKINNLSIPGNTWIGPYLKDISTKMTAVDKSGFEFLGWKNNQKNIIIPKASIWKYFDNGTDPGIAWKNPGYDDSSWKSGPAQLGYGDGDEATTIGYGGNSNNKYITSYFRYPFFLTSANIASPGFIITLLKDDGAVVYINGTEVLRSNLPCGTILSKTLASVSLSDPAESQYTSFLVNSDMLAEGENMLAVEVHQSTINSGDLSFDLEFAGLFSDNSAYLTTNRDLTITLTNDTYLTAVYQPTGQCIVPEFISGDFILSKDCSPYVAQGSIKVNYGSSLIIQQGVEIWMSPEANILVEGKIEAIATEAERILIKTNPAYGSESWGAITFLNTSDTSKLSFVTLEGASEGELPNRDNAALSAFNSDLVLDNLILVDINSNPIVARYSDIVLTNSSLHSNVTGDLINVKYGTARIENSVFSGNSQLDNDAIDYDGIKGGIIRNCKIYNFLGINSDGIDVGENCVNLSIDSVSVFNIFDKGISVGQNSSVNITNSIFVNCTMGMGLKDLSPVSVDRCSFYGNTIPIASYEKNPGSAGGITTVTNSILSNSSVSSFFCDSHSSLSIINSISDNTPLPSATGNIFSNPMFKDPTHMDFSLLPSSPAILTGMDNGVPINMGTGISKVEMEPYPFISHIFINPVNSNFPEFIGIYNPSEKTTDLSQFAISKGFTFTFLQGTQLGPGETLYLTSDAGSIAWYHFSSQVFQWTSGQLSNHGEEIELIESNGLVIDYLRYDDQSSWPEEAFSNGKVMVLNDLTTDNHFGENWAAEDIGNVFNSIDSSIVRDLKIYPNPTYNRVHIIVPAREKSDILIYSLQGTLLGRHSLNGLTDAEIDISVYNQGVVIIKVGSNIRKVVIFK